MRAPRPSSSAATTSASTSASSAEDERVVTHQFGCTNAGYRGWVWSVTVARAPRSKVVTVDEVVLLPSDDAILSPQWLPWDQRLRPGDLGVGDLMPTRADDPRLVPSWPSGDDDTDFAEPDESTRCCARSASSSGSAGRGCSRCSAASTPPTAGTPATPAPTRRWPRPRRALRHLRLLPAAVRVAAARVRRLRQRGHPGRRPGRLGRPRLRRPLRGRGGPPLLPEPPPVLLDTVGFDV